MMEFAKTYKDLRVFQKAYDASLIIHKTTLGFPKIEQYALGDQMRRSSKSICANIVEGFGKQAGSKKEFQRFLSMATGSCDEMQVWLRYAHDLGYIEKKSFEQWLEEYNHIARMLQALHKSIDG